MTLDNIHILLVEDDGDLREALCDTLALEGASVLDAHDANSAINMLGRQPIDIVVSDVNMPGMDGHQLLQQIRAMRPELPVVLMTAYATIERSVQAMRDGASDYLVKPFEQQALIDTVARYATGTAGPEDDVVAVESASVELFQLASRVAATDSTVLLSGESGTGKEVMARYIHRHSPRAKNAFVAINCAAIPENMLEAVLFGHEKGAFTGAQNALPGKFELADGGTLLLDEISEMDVGLQAKLLRVLQEREVERIGSRSARRVDVRVIATTNRDLKKDVENGRFREDLYYRLSVFPLECLPLRERPADIIPLAERLIRSHAMRMHRGPVQFDDSAKRALLTYRWPGNVRELDNAVQRALILQSGTRIQAAHLRLDPGLVPNYNAPSPPTTTDLPSEHDSVQHDEGAGLSDGVKAHEFQIIVDTLKLTGGSKSDAADKLGISPRTLRYKLAKMRESGLDVDAALQR